MIRLGVAAAVCCLSLFAWSRTADATVLVTYDLNSLDATLLGPSGSVGTVSTGQIAVLYSSDPLGNIVDGTVDIVTFSFSGALNMELAPGPATVTGSVSGVLAGGSGGLLTGNAIDFGGTSHTIAYFGSQLCGIWLWRSRHSRWTDLRAGGLLGIAAILVRVSESAGLPRTAQRQTGRRDSLRQRAGVVSTARARAERVAPRWPRGCAPHGGEAAKPEARSKRHSPRRTHGVSAKSPTAMTQFRITKGIDRAPATSGTMRAR